MLAGKKSSFVLFQTSFVGLTGKIEFDASGISRGSQYEICSSYKDTPNDLYHVGKWDGSGSLSLDNNHLFKNTFKDFGGKQLLVAGRSVSFLKNTDAKMAYVLVCLYNQRGTTG